MIRFGTIGTNWITEKFIQAASQLEDFELGAVYSRSREKAAEFAGLFGAPMIFTELEEMAKSDGIDAVYIASPNSLHAEQANLFMKNKKHVLCEKPMASNLSELKEMIKVCKENDVLLMEAMKTTFLPNYKVIEGNLHKIGPVRRLFINYCQYSSRYDSYKEGIVLNAFKPEFSNGALMDIGVYCIYPIVSLFGKPMEIKATGLKLESGVDGQGSLLMKYEEKEAVVMFSKITESYIPSEIQGEEGSILIDKINPAGKVQIHYRNGEAEDISVEQNSQSMFYEVKEFIRLVNEGQYESKINTFEKSLLVMEILDEARKQMGVVFPSDQNQ